MAELFLWVYMIITRVYKETWLCFSFPKNKSHPVLIVLGSAELKELILQLGFIQLLPFKQHPQDVLKD